MSLPTILTGLRANNNLHIGNYLGALLPFVDMLKTHSTDYQMNLFVPDLHSFITPINHSKLQEVIKSNLKIFVASGLQLDNPNIYIYRQSYIPAHSELNWILNCFTGFGEMSRMTQFKDKSSKASDDRVNLGIFNYPVLMAADILLYNAIYVPVGDDQSQHLEFTRKIAERINNKFGNVFTVPKSVNEQHQFFGKSQGLRIRDLADPNKKMSKSDRTGKGVIFLSDSPEVARKKIMTATTDSLQSINYSYQTQPGISNLLDILSAFGGDKSKFIGQKQYGPLKSEVSNLVSEFLTKFQQKLADVNYLEIESKLLKSEEILRNQANITLYRVQKAVGLR